MDILKIQTFVTISKMFHIGIITPQVSSPQVLHKGYPSNCQIPKRELSILFRGAWLAKFVEHATLDLGVVSLSPMLNVELT